MKTIPLRDFQREGAKALGIGVSTEPRLLQVAFHEPEPAPWPLIGPDSDDLVFLALAKATGAVLMTGNLGNFPEAIRDGVDVRSPGKYLAKPAGS